MHTITRRNIEREFFTKRQVCGAAPCRCFTPVLMHKTEMNQKKECNNLGKRRGSLSHCPLSVVVVVKTSVTLLAPGRSDVSDESEQPVASGVS